MCPVYCAHADMLICKYPYTNTATPAHQDQVSPSKHFPQAQGATTIVIEHHALFFVGESCASQDPLYSIIYDQTDL